MPIFFLFGLILTLSAHAEDTKTPPVFVPPVLSKPIPSKKGNCERLIRVGDEVFACDSPVATDAENLRSLLKNTPEALKELDLYQQNRKKVRIGAYTGSLGVFLILGNSLITNLVTKDQAARDSLGKNLRLAGVALTLGSVVYGITYLRSNETHLQNAMDRYNEKNPNKKIEFLFQTRF
jgi:hypothetical protein